MLQGCDFRSYSIGRRFESYQAHHFLFIITDVTQSRSQTTFVNEEEVKNKYNGLGEQADWFEGTFFAAVIVNDSK